MTLTFALIAVLDPETTFKDIRSLATTILTNKLQEIEALNDIILVLKQIWEARQEKHIVVRYVKCVDVRAHQGRASPAALSTGIRYARLLARVVRRASTRRAIPPCRYRCRHLARGVTGQSLCCHVVVLDSHLAASLTIVRSNLPALESTIFTANPFPFATMMSITSLATAKRSRRQFELFKTNTTNKLLVSLRYSRPNIAVLRSSSFSRNLFSQALNGLVIVEQCAQESIRLTQQSSTPWRLGRQHKHSLAAVF